jgi:hypothetical protein
VPEGTKIMIAAARPSTPGHRHRAARRRHRLTGSEGATAPLQGT